MHEQGRVLVADDSAPWRELISRTLIAHGYEVVTAPDGAAALEMVAKQPVDLVLLDWMMPGLEGPEVLRILRRKHPPNKLPIVMMTAKCGDAAQVETLTIGANDYLTKPLNLAVMVVRVQAQLALRRADEAQRKANQKLTRAVRKLIKAKRELKREVAARRRSEELMQYLARHDVLTGLGNRLLFRDEMDRALSRMHRMGEGFGLLCVDLDGLKSVNDHLGHDAGDEFLRVAARQMRSCLRDTDVVARLGGDEFAIIQGGAKGFDECAVLAQRIIGSIGAGCTVQGTPINASCSIGVVLSTPHDSDPDLLLKRADLALYQAKQNGRGTYRFFDSRACERNAPVLAFTPEPRQDEARRWVQMGDQIQASA